MSKKKNNLLIAASGTGGHIFPALSIAENIEKQWNISWLGVEQRCESELVPKKYHLFRLKVKAPTKKNIFLSFQYLKVILSTLSVVRIILKERINLVFTTGGYISAPAILASKILGVPIILHESNLVPGTVTKYFGSMCNYILTGFSETIDFLNSNKAVYTGTPLREQFYSRHKLPDWVPVSSKPLVLVMGGSQGAKGVNDMFDASLGFLLSANFRIIHLIGDTNKKKIDSKNKSNYIQVHFTNDMANLMQNCDLVISRAGAGTINELIAVRKPSILIPYPGSKNNHQERNALVLSSIGGAIIINQSAKADLFLNKTLKRIFSKKRKNKYEILDLMQKNMSQFKSNKSKNEIIKFINYFLKN